MILSNTEIHRAIDKGLLVIDPQPLPRFPEVGKNCPYDAHSVDLTLHNEVYAPEAGKYSIDLSSPGSIIDVIKKNSQRFVLSEDQPYTLKSGKFILARTVERVELPIQDDEVTLAARIEGKSSRARFGLIVHCTAPTIHPGFCGTITLEVVNLGPVNITLVPGMHIAQLIIEEVRGRVIKNPSVFQHQNNPTGSKD